MNLIASTEFANTWQYPPVPQQLLPIKQDTWPGEYRFLWYARGLDEDEEVDLPYLTLEKVNHARQVAGGHPLDVDEGGYAQIPDGGVIIPAGGLVLPGKGGPANPTAYQVASSLTGAYLALQQFRIRVAEMLYNTARYGARRPHNPANQNT